MSHWEWGIWEYRKRKAFYTLGQGPEGNAVREEGVGNYLTSLTTRDVVERAEVRTLLVVARLACAAAVILTHHARVSETHYPQVERIIFGHVCVIQPRRCTRYTCCICYYFSHLPPSSVRKRTEVWTVGRRITRLICYTSTEIAAHEPSVGYCKSISYKCICIYVISVFSCGYNLMNLAWGLRGTIFDIICVRLSL